MTAPQGVPTSPVVAAHGRSPAHARSNVDWVSALGASGPAQEAALRDLHHLMVRAAGPPGGGLRGRGPRRGEQRLDELANGSADEALAALLGKLATFQGRSLFTTWAYKFAILEAATQVRRQAWAGREVLLEDVSLVSVPHGPGPAEEAEARDLAAALARAMDAELTPYQRKIAVALLVDEVPIDVLAERLATTRGALYKTLHVARARLRAALVASGHLPAPPAQPTAARSTDRASATRQAPQTRQTRPSQRTHPTESTGAPS